MHQGERPCKTISAIQVVFHKEKRKKLEVASQILKREKKTYRKIERFGRKNHKKKKNPPVRTVYIYSLSDFHMKRSYCDFLFFFIWIEAWYFLKQTICAEYRPILKASVSEKKNGYHAIPNHK